MEAVESPPRLPLLRWALLAALLLVEWIVLAMRFSTRSLLSTGPAWATLVYDLKWALPAIAVATVTAAALLMSAQPAAERRAVVAAIARPHGAGRFVVGHLVAAVAFTALLQWVLEGGFAASTAQGWWLALWLATGILAIAFWAAAAVPPRVLLGLVRRHGFLLAGGIGVGLVAWLMGSVTSELWDPLRWATLWGVQGMVTLIASDPVFDPDEYLAGTERFPVRIAVLCAGYEGIGLIWVFLAAYLWVFRGVLRFPRALLLLPIGTAAIWIANLFRITALIAIGTWISPAIAEGGFHSFSGSLLFSGVALAIAWGAHHSRFFTTDAARADAETGPPTGAYLAPWLAIVLAQMATGAVSTGGLDALYGVRVAAGAAVLWWCWNAYAGEWRERGGAAGGGTLAAVALGALAWGLWLALVPAPGAEREAVVRAELATLGPAARAGWLVLRAAGFVVVAPLAEELAFRGYVMRRPASADFPRVAYADAGWRGALLSAALFGLMHQGQFVAAAVAGLLYALAAARRNRLADAVIAHAVTNGLLIVTALATGRWSVWL